MMVCTNGLLGVKSLHLKLGTIFEDFSLVNVLKPLDHRLKSLHPVRPLEANSGEVISTGPFMSEDYM